MEFKNQLHHRLSIYFNQVLKNSLKYKENFKIVVSPVENVVLIESPNESQLIQMMTNPDLKRNIEDSIQNGLNEKEGEGQFNIEIVIISETEFVIQY